MQQSKIRMHITSLFPHHGFSEDRPNARIRGIIAILYAFSVEGPFGRPAQGMIPKGTLKRRQLIRIGRTDPPRQLSSKRDGRKGRIPRRRSKQKSEQSSEPEGGCHPAQALTIGSQQPFFQTLLLLPLLLLPLIKGTLMMIGGSTSGVVEISGSCATPGSTVAAVQGRPSSSFFVFFGHGRNIP